MGIIPRKVTAPYANEALPSGLMSLETKIQSSAGVGEIGSVSLENAIEDKEDRKDGRC